ncbi:MAG: DUF6143 family protein [Clostridia bacterium]|nr:DUF6143 family protein [Clostridia bacterium]
MFEKKSKQPVEVVDITSPAMNSLLGRYFIGQTGTLNFGNKYAAWGGIINPNNSGVNLYFDIFTITNFSSKSFTGEIWLNAKSPKKSTISSTVTPSNQAISPPPQPKAIMEYADYITEPLTKGVNIFGRLFPQISPL